MNISFEEGYLPKTLEDLACYWFVVYAQNHKSASSLKRDQGMLRNYLLPAFGSMELKNLNQRMIEEWFSRLCGSGNLSSKSCNHTLGLLKKILGDGERWGFIPRNFAAFTRKKSLPPATFTFWSLDEIRQYFGYWSFQEDQHRILPVVKTALYTGLRRGELAALKWDHVDLDAGFICVQDSYCRIAKKTRGTTKSNKIRRVPINTVLHHHLTELKTITARSDYVHPFFNLDLYNREFKRSAIQAGVRTVRFHDLRHTFASHFVMGGGNVYDLQKILGHSSVQVTEIYAHLAPEHLKGKTEVLKF